MAEAQAHVRIIVNFEKRDFKIKVRGECTVGSLQIKVRRYLNCRPEEAIFMFWSRSWPRSDLIIASSKTMAEVQALLNKSPDDVLECTCLRENCFGVRKLYRL